MQKTLFGNTGHEKTLKETCNLGKEGEMYRAPASGAQLVSEIAD